MAHILKLYFEKALRDSIKEAGGLENFIKSLQEEQYRREHPRPLEERMKEAVAIISAYKKPNKKAKFVSLKFRF
jgi:hypothetical protein